MATRVELSRAGKTLLRDNLTGAGDLLRARDRFLLDDPEAVASIDAPPACGR